MQLSHVPLFVGDDAVPGRDRSIAQPVVVLCPVGAASRLVERHKRGFLCARGRSCRGVGLRRRCIFSVERKWSQCREDCDQNKDVQGTHGQDRRLAVHNDPFLNSWTRAFAFQPTVGFAVGVHSLREHAWRGCVPSHLLVSIHYVMHTGVRQDRPLNVIVVSVSSVFVPMS